MTNATQMLEVKRTLDGKIVEYPAERLLVETGVRAVLLCRVEEAEIVAGGRMTLPRGTLSVGYFRFDRPYNVYHWLYGGQTLVHYINIGRFRSLTDSRLVWDDYAVDVIVYPGGKVDVIDEDEIPETVDAATRQFIADATAAVLAERKAIVAAVEEDTRILLRAHGDVLHR